MTIKRGADDRLLAIAFAIMCIAGCIAHVAEPIAKPPKKPASTQTLADIAYDSFQARDVLRAKKLRELKGTRFDAKRMVMIEEAGAEASRETWKPVAEALAKRLDAISQTDIAAFDAVLEELATGAERAGK